MIGYSRGQKFDLKSGDRVMCNGFYGRVIRKYCEGMVEVRLARGEVCVSASYPDCYPVAEQPDRDKKAYGLIWRHTHRDYKGKVDGVKMIMINRSGGTTLVDLEGLTDEEFVHELDCARRAEERKQNAGAAR